MTPRRIDRHVSPWIRIARLAGALSALYAAPAWALTNPIVVENELPGNPSSEWDVAHGDASIQGFATEMSVAPGETVGFKVVTPATDYRIDIYRMGYYGGLGARRVATVEPSVALPQSQPQCLFENATRTIDCGNWALSASWVVPPDAVSGIYLAKLVREDPEDGRANLIVFVVRDDERHSTLLFQTSDTTWQAYNHYLGYSLYSNPRSYKVSYNRPVVLRGNEPWDWVFNAEYPMVRWLERNGYDVSYSSGMDSDRRGAEILEHTVYMSVGHDEYWSRGQRDAVTAARDAGVHLFFASGNEIYWKTRWEPSTDATHTPYRTLVCYKETQAGSKIDPLPGVWTGQWRDCSFSPPADGCDPENRLSGQISWTTALCGPQACGIQVPSDYGRMRLWRHTDIAELPSGQVASFPAATLGFEWDYQQFPNSAPPGLVWLSKTTSGALTHHLTLYRHRSGALVFGAGSIQWSWGLDDHHTNARQAPFAGGPPDARMQQFTVDVLAEMNAQPMTLQPELVVAVPSGDATPPVSTIEAPAAGDTLLAGPVVIHGVAVDESGAVGAVEVSVDGGTTWARAQGLENWTFDWVAPAHAGPVVLRSRAADDLGNLEAPGAGVAVEVGGPPLELQSVGAEDSVYVNGVETAHITVATRSNAGAADGMSLHVTVHSNLGETFEVGSEEFALGAHTGHSSEFSWPLPAAAHPWEFSVRAELSHAGNVLGVVTHEAAFSGMILAPEDLQRAVEQLAGPTGCVAPGAACRASWIGAVPHFGTYDAFAASLPAFCRSDFEQQAGRPARAGAYGLAAIEPAFEVPLGLLSGTALVADILPHAVAASIACSASLVAQGVAGFAPGTEVDSLATIARATFADAGRAYSNEVFVRGPVDLKIGRDGQWTSRLSAAVRGACVFDIAGTGIQWGHAGPAPMAFAASGTNPQARVDLQFRAVANGSVEFGFLHRTAADSILWVRYAPIPVVASKTIAHASLSNDLPYPWGFALFVDTQGDGIDDTILFPGGQRPSDAPPRADLRFRMLPNLPNPFNPSTTIRYVLPASGPVTVTLHDVGGRGLATLFHGVQSAGVQSVRWNGVAVDGRRLPSGVYVVRVATPWGTATQKLTLVK